MIHVDIAQAFRPASVTDTLEPTVTEAIAPGIYDMPEHLYRKDPCPGGSLSASGAKLILEAPAKYHYRQTAGEEHKSYFDFGKVAHSIVLGAGEPIEVIDVADKRGKKWSDPCDEARAAGRVPIIKSDYIVVQAMADELHRHPIAAALLNPERGKPEQTLIWHDLIWRRARLDWLPDVIDGGRVIVPDYKTAVDASPDAFGKAAASYGYAGQDDWYRAGVRQVLGVDDVRFVFIVQEKTPPYLVATYELTAYAQRIGAYRNEVAVRRYMQCMESGVWPGYSPDVEQLSLPRWAEIAYEEQIEMEQEGATR